MMATEKGASRLRRRQEGNGRKRHIVVDTIGLLLAVVVHAANIQCLPRATHGYRDGAKLVLAKLLCSFPRLQLIWADGAYGGKLVEWAKTVGGWTLELVPCPAQQRTLPSAAPPLGGGTHPGLAEPMPTVEQRLRGAYLKQ